MKASRSQKVLLAWSALFLGAAELVGRLPLDHRAATVAGAVEVALAIATGVAFGLIAAGRPENDRQP